MLPGTVGGGWLAKHAKTIKYAWRSALIKSLQDTLEKKEPIYFKTFSPS